MPANPSPLASATPDDLETWAAVLAEAQFVLGANNVPLQAAADLLRAVAKAEREGDWMAYQRTGRHAHRGFWLTLHIPVTDEHFTPIAALAALLEG